MRTKLMLTLAAIGAAGIATSMAQTNVYSVNAVGYINLTCPPGYSIIANQLNASTNQLATVIPTAPQDTLFIKWVGTTFKSFTYDAGAGWLDYDTLEAANVLFDPGEGAFFYNPATTNITVTLVGEVPTGAALTVALPSAYSLVSSIVPKSQDVVALGMPAVQDMLYLKWQNAGSVVGYKSYTFDAGAGWLDYDTLEPAVPQPAVGEGFFIYNPGALTNWVTSFSVNQ